MLAKASPLAGLVSYDAGRLDGYCHSTIGGMGRDFSDPVGQRGHWTARYCSGGCGRLWLNDGSCVRLRPERPNHVWSYDFSWTCKN
jgi:hypothetical protein